MQVLVIGGLGYIGSQVLDSLSRHDDYKDCEIVVVDNWAYGRGMPPLLAYFKDRIRRFRHHCLDISDPDSGALREIVGNSRYIVNCASLTQIPNSELHVKYIVDGVANLSRTILDTGPDLGKVIDISSTSIYGPVRTRLPGTPEPYAEDVYPDPEIALHNYAASKLKAESIWRSNDRGGIPVTIFRLSTVFGYAVGMRYNQFVNQFLVDAVAGRRTVLPGSPGNFRPYVHVGDAVELMLHLFDNAPETRGHVINIGAGRLNPEHGALFASLAEMLKDEFDIEPDYAFASELGRETIEESYKVDFTKFERMVGFPLRHDFVSGGRDLVRKIIDS